MSTTKRLLVLFFVMLISCTKEDITEQPLLLSEVIYGSWQIREAINVQNYGDREWHVVSFLENRVTFSKDNQYTYYYQEQVFETATFKINDRDSTIELSAPIRNNWFVEEYAEEQFIVRFDTDEGVEKYKYVRLE
jgi:hypothetical protein